MSDIFKQKMNDLFRGFEFICAYIYDFLIPTKGYWNDHVHKLELTLNKMKEKGLKFNIEIKILDKPKGYYTDHVQKLELRLNKMKEKGITYSIERYFSKKPKWDI